MGNENNKQCIKYEAWTNDDAMCVNHLLHPKNAVQVHLTKSRPSFTYVLVSKVVNKANKCDSNHEVFVFFKSSSTC